MKWFILLANVGNAWGNGALDKNEPGTLDSLTQIIINIANIAIALVGTIALLFLIIGGFQYIASAGNPDNIGKAKQTILYAVIGLILVILSYSVINLLISKTK